MTHVARIAGAGLIGASALVAAATASAAGQPYQLVTDEIPVNLFTPGKQIPFSIAGNARGDFVVGWSSNAGLHSLREPVDDDCPLAQIEPDESTLAIAPPARTSERPRSRGWPSSSLRAAES